MMLTMDSDRFQRKIRFDGSGCHRWTANKSKSGYGRLTVARKDYRAHRWVYEQTKGEIPEGLQIDHTCNNRDCVNPDHLQAVTARENVMASHSSATARLNSEKQKCPRGHDFAAWNNNPSTAAKGERACKACHLARARNKYRNRPSGWWLAEADRLFNAYRLENA